MLSLKAIIAYNGGLDTFCDKLGLKKGTVYRWQRERKISAAYILPILKISDGKFTAEELLGGHDDA